MTNPKTIVSHLCEAIDKSDINSFERYFKHPRCPSVSDLTLILWNHLLNSQKNVEKPISKTFLEKIQNLVPIKTGRLDCYDIFSFFENTSKENQKWFIETIANKTSSYFAREIMVEGIFLSSSYCNKASETELQEIYALLNKKDNDELECHNNFQDSEFKNYSINKLFKRVLSSLSNYEDQEFHAGQLFFIKNIKSEKKWQYIGAHLVQKKDSYILNSLKKISDVIEIDWNSLNESIPDSGIQHFRVQVEDYLLREKLTLVEERDSKPKSRL